MGPAVQIQIQADACNVFVVDLDQATRKAKRIDALLVSSHVLCGWQVDTKHDRALGVDASNRTDNSRGQAEGLFVTQFVLSASIDACARIPQSNSPETLRNDVFNTVKHLGADLIEGCRWLNERGAPALLKRHQRSTDDLKVSLFGPVELLEDRIVIC